MRRFHALLPGVDPKEQLSGVLMIQRNGGVAPVQNTFQTMTYQAIVGPAGR